MDRLRFDVKQGCKSKVRVDAAQAAKLRRAESRATVLASFRRITDSPGSPPVPERPLPAAAPPVVNRRQQLERWKKEKEEKEKIEKAKAKPIFKLRTVISHTTYPSMVEVPPAKPAKYVGMATRSRTATATKAPPTVSKKPPPKPKAVLADVKDDKKFVAPKSVKPIALTIPHSPFGMSRRQKQGMAASTLANMPHKLLKAKFAEAKGRAVFSALASAPSPARNVSFNFVPAEPICPSSPNITVARGNYQQRKRSLSKSIIEATVPLPALTEETPSPSLTSHSPSAPECKENNASVTISTESEIKVPTEKVKDALFYRTQLDSEISRLNKLCEQWSATKNELSTKMTEEIEGVLDSAIGHTQLLIRSKFEQFRGLTIQCESGTSTPPILVTDLEGFWDMLSIQVENLDREFQNLDVLKQNGWKKQQPIKVQIKKNTVSKKPLAINVGPVKPSGLKALMLAARKKQMAEKVIEDKFNTSITSMNSCVSDAKLEEIKGTPERSTKRMSLLQGVLSNSVARKAERNSPIVMRVSLNAKAAGLVPVPVQAAEVAVATAAPSDASLLCETVAAPSDDVMFVKPSAANPLPDAIRGPRKSMSEGKVRKPRERKRLTMVQQLQKEYAQFETKKSDTTGGCEKENETFVSSSNFFSPRRSLRLTPYKRRSVSVDARPSLMPMDNWPSPLPLPSGELISFDTPPRRSTRRGNPK